MKALVASFVVLFALGAQARDLVLVTGFDPFGGARVNHSWVVAQSIRDIFQNDPNIEIALCQLPTTYAGAYPKLAECYNNLPQAPLFVLSLGEGPKELNLETQVYNMDHNPRGNGNAADNAGARRNRSPIIAGAPFNVGLRVDVAALYCALSPAERATTVVSATPGNFVCNNASYQFTSLHPEVPFTFAHVVGQKAKNIQAKLRAMPRTLSTIIRRQVELSKLPAGPTPHVTNSIRMPIKRDDLAPIRAQSSGCELEFYNKLHGDMLSK